MFAALPENWQGPAALLLWVVTGLGGIVFWYFKVRKIKAFDDIEVSDKQSRSTEAQKDRQAKREQAILDHRAGQSQAMFERALQAYEEALEDERAASAKREQLLLERMDARDRQHIEAMRLLHADHTNCQRELAKLTERVVSLEAELRDNNGRPPDRRDAATGADPRPVQ